MVLGLLAAVLMEAMVLRPCHAEWRFPSINFCSTLFLYFSLAILMARLTSLLTFFISNSEPVKKILFFLFRISLSSLVIQGLLLGKIVTVFEGTMLSTQKEMYDETVSTCSLMLLEVERRLSQSVDSKHPCRDWILSSVHCLMFLVTFIALLTTGVYTGARRIVW